MKIQHLQLRDISARGNKSKFLINNLAMSLYLSVLRTKMSEAKAEFGWLSRSINNVFVIIHQSALFKRNKFIEEKQYLEETNPTWINN